MRARLRPLTGLLAALALFELIIRHVFLGVADWKPGVGWGYYSTEVRRYIHEGAGTSHFDARGIRIVPGSVPAGPPILALGNSMTQAAQVDDGEAYTAQLQSLMHMPVLNAAHDARLLADQAYAAPFYQSHFHPAWTIVQMIPLNFQDPPAPAHSASFQFVEGHLVVEPPIPDRQRTLPLHEIRDMSGLLNLGTFRYGVFLQAMQRENAARPLFHGADRIVAAPAHDEPVELILDLLTTSYKRRVTFFMIPDFRYPQTDVERRFTAWCQTRGASCVNLRSTFDAFRGQGRAPSGFPNYNFGHGHLNPEGHKAAAELLAQELERLRARGLF